MMANRIPKQPCFGSEVALAFWPPYGKSLDLTFNFKLNDLTSWVVQIPAPEKSRHDSFRFGVRPVERETGREKERESAERRRGREIEK